MSTHPPFEVSKAWQEAMSIVSVNAGLLPRELLNHYYHNQPIQNDKSPHHTAIDLRGSKRAADRHITAITICYEDTDPSKISSMLIFLDEIDPATRHPLVRILTNTSINHVLEKEAGANCPLWLKVHTSSHAKHSPTPYHVIPCCSNWIEDMDFKLPISNEEKQLPAVVDRVFKEVRSKERLLEEKEQALAQKEEELQVRDAQLITRRGSLRDSQKVAAPVDVNNQLEPASVGTMAELQQHGVYIAVILVLLGVMAFIR